MPLPITTLIAIIVPSSAGLLIFLLIIYLRCLRQTHKPVPLPPKQELARYREPHIVTASSQLARQPTWYDPGKLSAPASLAPFSTSRSSLVPPDNSLSRHASFQASETLSEDLSYDAHPISVASLALPHLSFDNSSTSLSTVETDSPPIISATNSSFSLHHQSRRPSSSSRPPRRHRPLSVGSSSHNTIRGVPHGPHSQVQIVLPQPLAFQSGPNHPPQQRYSVVDQWALTSTRSYQPQPQPQQPIPRPLSSAPRRSTSQSSLGHARRPVSTTSTSVPRDPLPHQHHIPPVPRLPPELVASLTGATENFERGRSHEMSTDRIPLPVDKPPPPPAKILQKRSRSRGRSGS
ncbi:hypothetical protein MIND_00461900 [Mycena indigotica]|uniref:Uncharacterized protein n=1 Tax=Mycena indigotica TaxID=2126181 RepID=A0A8H6SYL4_9AGAR|nr:uncharacterized protein MIND_00461900 [Mycena indigotica]KAF7306702.1 hypothetical protein MIND_00461900 [Mycena indigotica]